MNVVMFWVYKTIDPETNKNVTGGKTLAAPAAKGFMRRFLRNAMVNENVKFIRTRNEDGSDKHYWTPATGWVKVLEPKDDPAQLSLFK